MKDEVTGVILVGGKSSRIGCDKAFLPIGGIPVFERVLEVLRKELGKVVLVGDRPVRFAKYGLTVYPDLYAGCSLGGLYTGLHLSETQYIFAASCDLPFASAGLLRYLVSLRKGYDVVVPLTEGHPEPLFALYSKNCLDPMKEMLEAGNFRIYDLYPLVRVRRVPGSERLPFDRSGNDLLNINTLEEYERALIEGADER